VRMRAPALASLLAVAVSVAACGRVGYEALPGDDTDAADDTDAGDPDATDTDAPPGVQAICGQAVMVQDFGLAQAATYYGIDVAGTSTGFLVAWTAGLDDVNATGIQVHPGPYLDVIQPQTLVEPNATSGTMSIAAIGDAAMLGLDDPGGPGIRLYALNERGLERSSQKYIDNDRAYGHAFVTDDATNDLFVVMGASGTATSVYTRDHDIHPRTGPQTMFSVATESAGAALVAGGYVLMTGNSSNCDLLKVDGNFSPIGSSQPIAMTCHNASAVTPVGASSIVAGWNCDNDQVWVTSGDLSGALPAERSVAGGSPDTASNPRLGVTSDGVWYAYELNGGRIGRTLLDASGNTAQGLGPSTVRTSAAIKAYDLAVHGDTAFLFWIEQATRTELWAMKLCVP
jgi:predicted small lipoprotein YifL